MQRVISKTVTALWPGGQLLQDQFFRDIRERIFGQDRYTQQEDTGIDRRKKISVFPAGVGSRFRENNPGAGQSTEYDEEQEAKVGVGSAYNDGEQADDETGPGQTPIVPDPYWTSDWGNDLYAKLNLSAKEAYPESIISHIKKIRQGPGIIMPHRRHSVDEKKKKFEQGV